MVRNTYEVQSLGELLREKRKSLGKDIKDVSTATKIRTEYLLALEQGSYSKFVSAVYAKGFLKKYAKYLGISPDRAIAMYRREQKEQLHDRIKSTNYVENNRKLKPLKITLPRVISTIVIVLVLGFGYYLFSQATVVLNPPELTLTNPVIADSNTNDNITYRTTDSTVTLSGRLQIGSTLELNGVQQANITSEIYEISELNLDPGSNQFNLVAESQFGQISEINLTVIRTTTDEVDSFPASLTNPNDISQLRTAEIIPLSETPFIELSIDQVPEYVGTISQATNPYQTFEYQEQFTITTRQLQGVQVDVFGQSIILEPNQSYIFVINEATNQIEVEL